jgi:glycosyltransferase involved in cell wall biosynthesis
VFPAAQLLSFHESLHVSSAVKVLHLVDSLGPGGMENGIVNLAHGLAPQIESHVACLVRSGPFAERLPPASHVVELGKGNGFSPLAVWRLFACIRRLKPTVLHTHNLGPLIYGSFATGFGRVCPIIHGEHSRLTEEEKTPRRLRQRRRFYRACRAVHSVSAGIRDEVIALDCNPTHMVAIPNGVDTETFSPGNQIAARKSLGLPESGRTLGIVGRFGAEKGHGVHLDAFELLADRFPDLRLAIIGAGGPAETEIRARADRSSIRSRIVFTGFLVQPVEAYRSLDLLTIPSTNEGMANAALEGMACGCAILANTDCGHEEFLEHGRTGIIADLRSPPGLAAAIEELIFPDGRLRALAAEARVAAVQRFSLRVMVNAYRHLYAEAHTSSAR